MLTCLRRKTSLNNLCQADHKGQIATVLILFIAAILIFILVTVNLGKVSLTATNLANAADSSALYLASQLATHAYHLFHDGLGGQYSKCKKGGFASLVFAIVFAVVAIVITVVTWGWGAAVWAGAIGGAVGGGVGAAYAGTNVAQGIFQGAIIGASLAYGASGIAGAPASTALSAGSTAPAGSIVTGTGTLTTSTGSTITLDATLTSVTLQTPATVSAGSAGLTMTAPLGMSAAASGILSAGSTVYNAYVGDQASSEAIRAASRMLNGLPQYYTFKEGTILQAFLQTIDDPNKEEDVDDLDNDGDKTDMVPKFLYWWKSRQEVLKKTISTLESLTNTFVHNNLGNFRDWLYLYIVNGKTTYSYYGEEEVASYEPPILGRMERAPQASYWYGSVEGADGPVVKLARGLEDGGYPVEFFVPGEPGSGESGEEIDQIEQVVAFVKDLIVKIDELLAEEDLSRLASGFDAWINTFYDPTSEWYEGYVSPLGPGGIWTPDTPPIITADLHDVIKNSLMHRLNSWISEIRSIQRSLPLCEEGYWATEDWNSESYDYECLPTCSWSQQIFLGCSSCVTNPICRYASGGGTLDHDGANHINDAIFAIDKINRRLTEFLGEIVAYYNSMKSTLLEFNSDANGGYPATYKWTDTTGEHSVIVETSAFKVARTVVTESGNWMKKEVCVHLVDYSDSGGNTWVKITRKDPSQSQVGLGNWNPFLSGISKKGKASYSIGSVTLSAAE